MAHGYCVFGNREHRVLAEVLAVSKRSAWKSHPVDAARVDDVLGGSLRIISDVNGRRVAIRDVINRLFRGETQATLPLTEPFRALASSACGQKLPPSPPGSKQKRALAARFHPVLPIDDVVEQASICRCMGSMGALRRLPCSIRWDASGLASLHKHN
jgi:hypothetical protein